MTTKPQKIKRSLVELSTDQDLYNRYEGQYFEIEDRRREHELIYGV